MSPGSDDPSEALASRGLKREKPPFASPLSFSGGWRRPKGEFSGRKLHHPSAQAECVQPAEWRPGRTNRWQVACDSRMGCSKDVM